MGETDVAREALDRLAEMTQPAGTDWALGAEARSRALLSDGEDADLLYREAIERFGRTGLRPELARAHLLYGEWLRREGQRRDAREQLRTAHDMFAAIGMEGFAERARRELLATGERARKRSEDTRWDLTAQEAQIAQLARRGLLEPRDRSAAVPQPTHGRVAPAQGIHQARHQLPQRARRSTAHENAGTAARVGHQPLLIDASEGVNSALFELIGAEVRAAA